MDETLTREHAHLPSFPIGSGMFRRRSNIGLALTYEHLVDLFWEGITIIDNLASPSIYNRQFLDPELVPRLCEDMIAHVVRLIRSSWEGDEHGDALGLVGIEDDCDTAIGHRSWWCSPVCERGAAGAVDSRLLKALPPLTQALGTGPREGTQPDPCGCAGDVSRL